MKNKYITAILAFLLGWFWFHRFYLWQVRGVLYLIFCWTFIPSLIAFIETIYFLIISEKEFDIKYNADYIIKQDYMKNRIVTK